MNSAFKKALLFALATVTVGHNAQAQPADSGGPARDRARVEIFVLGGTRAVREVRVVARELLARLQVTTVVSEVSTGDGSNEAMPSKPAPALSAYIDLRALSAPQIVVVDRTTRRELVRRTLPPSPTLESAVEATAHVLYRIVESELELGSDQPAAQRSSPPQSTPPPAQKPRRSTPLPARERARERPARPARAAAGAAETVAAGSGESGESEEPASADVAAARPTSAWGFDAAAVLRGVTLGSRHFLPGAGIGADVHGRAAPVGFGVLLLGTGHLASEVALGEVAARFQLFSFRAMPLLDFRLDPRISGFAGTGLGIDWFRATPERAPPSARRTEAASNVDFVLSGLMGIRFGLGNRSTLFTALGLDVDMTPKVYVVDNGAEREVLIELPRLRPSLLAGMSFSMAGEPRFRPFEGRP